MDLIKKANEIRIKTLKIIKRSGMGHLGSDLSCTDILVSLYYDVLNVNSKNFEDPNRDRYIQSKGHAVEVLWAILNDKGYITDEELSEYGTYESRLIGHPNNLVPGIEMNTGSLGHGLSIGVGMAIAAKLDQKKYMTYVLLGDGELAEGSVWEAAMCAAHYQLDNLVAIVDKNGLQISGETDSVMSTEPLSDKWKSFGWEVLEVTNGNDPNEISNYLKIENISEKPRVIIAHTIKGMGIKAAENVAGWHHKVPNDQEYDQALIDLGGNEGEK